MASYEKRGKKTRVIVSVMQRGVRTKITKTFKKSRDAKDWATLMEADKIGNHLVIASKMTFSDYFKKWYTLYKAPELRESTMIAYDSDYKRIKKIYKDTRLSELTTGILQNGITEFGKTHKKETVVMFVARIKASLKDAKLDEYIVKDIYSRLKATGKPSTDKIKALSARDFKILQSWLYAHTDSQINRFLLVAIESGLREGEIIALQQKDISTAFDTISVTKTWSEATHKIGKPKTKTSNRIVSVTSDLINAIQPFFTTDQNARPFKISPLTLRYNFKKVLKKLNLPDLTIHQLRHSHASYLLYKGLSIDYVSKRLGHSTVATTLKYYAHMLPEKELSDKNKMLNVLSVSPNVPKASKKARG